MTKEQIISIVESMQFRLDCDQFDVSDKQWMRFCLPDNDTSVENTKHFLPDYHRIPDWDGIEEYISISEFKFPDAVPSNIREWTAIKEQYELFIELLKNNSNEEEVKKEAKKIIEQSYKNSIIELFKDLSEAHIKVFIDDFNFSKSLIEVIRYSNIIFPIVQRMVLHTIAQDLVAVQPIPGPSADLLYLDFQYNMDE